MILKIAGKGDSRHCLSMRSRNLSTPIETQGKDGRRMRKAWGMLTVFALCCCLSCSTRQVVDEFNGSTAQRLTTYSVDAVMEKLPDDHFSVVAGKRVHLECAFLDESPAIDYARQRLKMELIERYHCSFVETPETAEILLRFFFNSIGTDVDYAGFRTPEFAFPGMPGIPGIDLLTFDMFHGVAECHYYILDADQTVLTRGDRIKSVVRTDKIGLPIVSIPINNLE